VQASENPTFNFRSRNSELDILRGLAIIAVILNHAGPETIPDFPELEGAAGFVFWQIKGIGWSGVDLFFILSGFLIGGSLINEIEKYGGIDLKLFWLKRCFKILPSYGALLIVLPLTGAVELTLREIPVFLLFLQNYLAPQVVGPTWSLAVEEHFYVLLPLLLTALILFCRGDSQRALRNMPYLAILVITLVVAGRLLRAHSGVENDDFMQSHFRFDTLFMGVLLHWIWRYRSGFSRRIAHPATLLAISLLIAPAMFLSRNDAIMFSIGFSLLAIGYALLTLFALEHGFGRFGASATGSIMASIGRWSYNIYLWHLFVLAAGFPFYEPIQLYLSNCGMHPLLQAIAQIGILLLFSILIGWLFTMIVEEPFLKLRNKFIKRRSMSSREHATVKTALSN
jgi:peptidoglycan/LPS O-acetylase OafA/YrhL